MTRTDPFHDTHGRGVSYMRLSVTDRCNLRCRYCVKGKMTFMPHEKILSYEEMLTLIGVTRELGIRKLRLTGGEPFVRKDFLWFLEQIRHAHPDLDLRLTTNATLLGGKVRDLTDLGVRRVNISLDTLDAAKFAAVTGRDFFGRVRAAIDECLEHGLGVKINAVAMRGVNDDELPAFLRLASELPVDVRFIEFMPMGEETLWDQSVYWSAEDILARARELADLAPVSPSGCSSGPARMYSIRGGRGRLGLISPLSNHFCATCNRLRITPDGRLRTCLFLDREYRLRPVLRHPRLGHQAVLRVIRRALDIKPLGYEILAARKKAVARKHMTAIGG